MSNKILISCSKKKKKKGFYPAKLLYDSPLFKLSYKYAKKLQGDIFILSAKYGLIEENYIVKNYDLTLNNFSIEERKQWANKVAEKIKTHFDINDTIIFLAGKNYYEYIIPNIKNKYEIPLKNLTLGKRISYLIKQ